MQQLILQAQTNVEICGEANAACPGDDMTVAGDGACSLPFSEFGPEYSIPNKP